MDRDRIVRRLIEWSAEHGVPFVWHADEAIAMSAERGCWRATLAGDDIILVHPTDTHAVLQLLSGASGMLDTSDLDEDELVEKLAAAPEWFSGWRHFMSGGPGRGH